MAGGAISVGDLGQSCATLLSAAPNSGPSEIASKIKSCRNSLSANRAVAEIEERRLAAGLSVTELARRAGITAYWYRTLRRRRSSPKSSVLRKLDRAFDAPPSFAVSEVARARSMWGAMVMALAEGHGVTAADVVASDPRAGKTADRTWSACARVRQAAIYLVVTKFGVPQRRLAEALDLTPAAVCLALKAVEDRRDDPAFDAALDRAARMITGGGA